MRLMWILLVALLLAGAGCLDDESGAGDGEDETPVDPGNGGGMAQEPIVETGTGMTGASAGQPGAAAGFGGEGATFEVPDGAEVLLAEIRWDDPVQDVDLALSSPEQEGTEPRMYDHTAPGGEPGAPDSPHSLVVNGPMEGEWQLTAFGNGATAAMEYEWAVTVFFGPVPEGYTAFEAA